MKIYIMADQEGCACVFDRHEGYLYAREYATIELAAVCRALLEAGVDEVLLNSVHQIEYHKLPRGVRVLHGLDRHDVFTEGLDGSFAAVMIVGMHEMAGGREKGCWRHTMLPHPITYAYSSVEAVWLNDTLVGETGITAAFAGAHGVPVVYLSGDHWACLEAEELLPDIATVAVKRGTGYFSAISHTPDVAAEMSAAGALRGLEGIGKVAPWRLEGPVTLKVRYQFAERTTEAVAAVPGAVRVDERTVAVTHPTVADLRDSLGAIRAPETEIYRQDTGFAHTTGLFTRTGGEPFTSQTTMPLPGR